MKFRRSAVTITIYFLFTLLWMTFFINASENKNTNLIRNDHGNEITQNFQQDDLQPPVNTMKLLHLINSHILSTIFNEFLTIHEILILRKTCTNFQILLFPNDKNMVMFCKDFSSKENDDVPLTWFDLKYFLNESYGNALEKMKMLNLKQNQYAVFTRDQKKIISWHNEQALHLYPTMILNKIKNKISQPLLNYDFPQIYTKDGDAWAKITKEGNIITGGDELYGGNSNHVQSKLKNVKMIASTYTAFAALLDNGNVVAWGDEYNGGKIPKSIEIQLEKNVKMIFSNFYAFAALLHDGRVVVWGNPYREGGQISESIKTQLQNVKTIVSNHDAFVALLHDGQIVAWGDEFSGGKIPKQIEPLLQKNVKMIFCNDYAFAALTKNGNIIVWGRSGGKIPEPIKPYAKKIKTIFSSSLSFAALSHGGSVFSWGGSIGNIPYHIQKQLHKNVKMIYSNDGAFVASLKDGHFVAWGDEDYGGKITIEMKTKLQNVKAIFSSFAAFAALLDDGSVFTWGCARYGGEIPEKIQSKLIKNVKTIFPHKNGFTAICKNGEMIQWGGGQLCGYPLM